MWICSLFKVCFNWLFLLAAAEIKFFPLFPGSAGKRLTVSVRDRENFILSAICCSYLRTIVLHLVTFPSCKRATSPQQTSAQPGCGPRPPEEDEDEGWGGKSCCPELFAPPSRCARPIVGLLQICFSFSGPLSDKFLLPPTSSRLSGVF